MSNKKDIAYNIKDWPDFLQPSEFPTDPNGASVLKYMDAKVIRALMKVREIAGCPLVPSQDPEAHVRFTGSEGSRHYAIDRLSDATDFKCVNNKDAWKLWEAAKQVPEINGLGIYFDFNSGKFGIHIDVRPTPRIQWVCPIKSQRFNISERDYVYLHNDPEAFYYEIHLGFNSI